MKLFIISLLALQLFVPSCVDYPMCDDDDAGKANITAFQEKSLVGEF